MCNWFWENIILFNRLLRTVNLYSFTINHQFRSRIAYDNITNGYLLFNVRQCILRSVRMKLLSVIDILNWWLLKTGDFTQIKHPNVFASDVCNYRFVFAIQSGDYSLSNALTRWKFVQEKKKKEEEYNYSYMVFFFFFM